MRAEVRAVMPKWTKQDYETVAEVLYTTGISKNERDSLYIRFNEMFSNDNLRFNTIRFQNAVYGGYFTRRSRKQPIWTKRDFEAIAHILKTGKDFGWLSLGSHEQLVQKFAEKSARMNPRFDFQRFERAAYRRPPEARVRQYLRRCTVVDRFGHRIFVGEWQSQKGLSKLRHHYKRSHPRASRASIRKGVATRKRRAR